MDNIDDEYKHYWETNMFLQRQELDSWGGMEEAFSGYYDDASSPDGGGGSGSSSAKNIVSERNRRMKLNERLIALRSIVPNITKMDKASIIKDAITYIQELQEQERRIKTEIAKHEPSSINLSKIDQDYTAPCSKTSKKKKPKLQISHDSSLVSATSLPIHLLELRVSQIGEKTVVVSLTCSKSADTVVKLSEVLESLKLNVVTTNITTISGRVMNTIFIEADEEESKQLEIRIRTAIEKHNDPDCSTK